jgi:hypothetical protein
LDRELQSLPIAREYQAAVDHATVFFEQIVQADFGRRCSEEPQERAIYAHYYPQLLERFAEAHKGDSSSDARGGILRFFFASHIPAAAVMTGDNEIFVEFRPATLDDVEFIDLLIKLARVHLKARRILRGEDLRTSMETVFTVISYCLASLDMSARAAGKNESEKAAVAAERAQVLGLLKSECEQAEEDLDAIVHRRAERTYFNSMLVTALVLVLAGIVASWMLASSRSFNTLYKFLLVTGVAGSLGATISVMSRMTFGRFSLSQAIIALQHGKRGARTLQVMGAIRPVIGAVFGIVFFVLERSGLLPLKLPESPAAMLYFYAAIAFLAGFSERWAQSTFKGVMATVDTTTSQARSSRRTIKQSRSTLDGRSKNHP